MGLTLEELAYQSGLYDRYIGKIERGEKHISLEIFAKVNKALNVTMGEFFNIVDPIADDKSIPLIEITELLKSRSIDEQYKILEIIKTVSEMLDRKQ